MRLHDRRALIGWLLSLKENQQREIREKNMARAPNYNHERKERDRQKAAKKAEKAAAKAAKNERAKDGAVKEEKAEEA
jgi:hypothetical protein